MGLQNLVKVSVQLRDTGNHKRSTMGNKITLPVEMRPELGMFCISLRPFHKIELIHAPPVVAACVRRVANEVNGLYARKDSFETPSRDKFGVLQLSMSSWLFTTGNGKEPATLGKLFCIRILEELHKMGYDLQIGSDLTRARFAAGSLFFRKVSGERPTAKVVCIAPGKQDTIVLLNHNERVKSMVENAIKDAWPSGIQWQEEQEVLGHTVHDIKINGYPWWTSEANIDNNRIINMIVQNLSKINVRLVGGINIKGGTDSLFFIEDPGSNAQFSSISLCQKNRLRLVDCKEESQCVRQAIVNSGFRIDDESLKEHHAKMRLNGSPWHCSGVKAVQARQLVARISEAMLQRGWALTDAIDISRREDDKSMLLFRRCVPTTASFSCICLTSTEHLRLVNFSPGDQEVLKTCIMENYLPGVARVDTSGGEGNSMKFDLVGSPWDNHSGGLHGRSLLVHLFAAAVNLGFQIAASADVSSKFATDSDGNPDYPLDVHSIYLVKMPTQGKIEQNLLPTYQEAMM